MIREKLKYQANAEEKRAKAATKRRATAAGGVSGVALSPYPIHEEFTWLSGIVIDYSIPINARTPLVLGF